MLLKQFLSEFHRLTYVIKERIIRKLNKNNRNNSTNAFISERNIRQKYINYDTN